MPSDSIADTFKSLIAERDRLAAEEGFLPERIGVARRLAALDPADPEHRHHQAELETTWIRRAPAEIESAMAGRDAASAALIATILSSNGWAVAPPGELRQQADGARAALDGSRVLDAHADLLAALQAPDPSARLKAWSQLQEQMRASGHDPASLRDPRLDAVRILATASQATRRKLAIRLAVGGAGALLLVGASLGTWSWMSAKREAHVRSTLDALGRQVRNQEMAEADRRLAQIERDEPNLVPAMRTLDLGRRDRRPTMDQLPDDFQADTVVAIRLWRGAEEKRTAGLADLIKRLDAKGDVQLTGADSDALAALIATPDERQAHAKLMMRVMQAVEANTKRDLAQRAAALQQELDRGLREIAAAKGIEAVKMAGAGTATRLDAIRMDAAQPAVIRAKAEGASGSLVEAVQERVRQLEAEADAARDLAAMQDEAMPLAAYLAAVDSFARKHPDHVLAAPCTAVLRTRPALAGMLAWEDAWISAAGDAQRLTDAATTVLRSQPDLANAEALRNLGKASGNADVVPALREQLAGARWRGWQELSAGDKRMAVPSTWRYRHPVEFGGQIVLEVPLLQTLAQLEGREKTPPTTLRLDRAITIAEPVLPAGATLADRLDSLLQERRITGEGAPLALAGELAVARSLDPLFQAQAVKQALSLLTLAQLAACPEPVRTFASSLDGLTSEALWLRPDEPSAQQASTKAKKILASAPDLAKAAKALSGLAETRLSAAAPWNFAGRIVRGKDGATALAMHPDLHDGRLMACTHDGRRHRWQTLGTVSRGVAVPTGLGDDLPAGTPVLLAPSAP